MKTYSWSELAREKSDDFIKRYLAEDEEGRKNFHKWLIEDLLNQYRYMGNWFYCVGHWRAPLVEKRIAKRFGRLRRKYLTK